MIYKKYKKDYPSKHSHFKKESISSFGSNVYEHSGTLQTKKKRIMNYKLIQVQGIPRQFASLKTLCSKSFFGRYGTISNIRLNDKDQEGKLSETVNAYITFESEINSSLALLGAHNTTHKNRKITAYFGTNRYCHSFLMNDECQKRCCFYLHEIDTQNDAQKPQHLRQMHLDRAFSIVATNLTKAISIQIDEKKYLAGAESCLRSVEGILGRMIRKDKLTLEQYQKAKKKGKIASQRIVLLTRNQNQSQTCIPQGLSASSNLENGNRSPLEKMSSSIQIQSFPSKHEEDKVQETEESQKPRKYTGEEISEMIAGRILKQLNKKRSLSRLPFAQSGRLKLDKIFYEPEDEETRHIRQKITRSLLQG